MKQKLVDVDKIKSKYNDNWPSEIAEGFQMAIDAIEDAPTANAIPIEWVVGWLTKQHVPATHTCDDYYAVEMMLEDWENENGLLRD